MDLLCVLTLFKLLGPSQLDYLTQRLVCVPAAGVGLRLSLRAERRSPHLLLR